MARIRVNRKVKIHTYICNKREWNPMEMRQENYVVMGLTFSTKIFRM